MGACFRPSISYCQSEYCDSHCIRRPCGPSPLCRKLSFLLHFFPKLGRLFAGGSERWRAKERSRQLNISLPATLHFSISWILRLFVEGSRLKSIYHPAFPDRIERASPSLGAAVCPHLLTYPLLYSNAA